MSDDNDADWRSECLRDYVNERMSPKDFADHIGVTVTQAYRILCGRAWKDIPRPEGFEHPWTDQDRRADLIEQHPLYRKGLQLFKDLRWTHHQLGLYLGVSADAAYRATLREGIE